MKSIKAAYLKEVKHHPDWSSILCFREAVKGRRFHKTTLQRNFNTLVDKDDYAPNEKERLYGW